MGLAIRGDKKATTSTPTIEEIPNCLSLDGLQELSGAQAMALSRYSGSLSLNGIKHLTDSAAEGLAQNESSLSLRGITKLSDSAAKAFESYKGQLWLAPKSAQMT